MPFPGRSARVRDEYLSSAAKIQASPDRRDRRDRLSRRGSQPTRRGGALRGGGHLAPPIRAGDGRQMGAPNRTWTITGRSFLASGNHLRPGCDCVIEASGSSGRWTWPPSSLGSGDEYRRLSPGRAAPGQHAAVEWRGLDVINSHERDPRCTSAACAPPSRRSSKGSWILDRSSTHHSGSTMSRRRLNACAAVRTSS